MKIYWRSCAIFSIRLNSIALFYSKLVKSEELLFLFYRFSIIENYVSLQKFGVRFYVSQLEMKHFFKTERNFYLFTNPAMRVIAYLTSNKYPLKYSLLFALYCNIFYPSPLCIAIIKSTIIHDILSQQKYSVV